MNRRDLLKAGILAAGLAAAGCSGVKNGAKSDYDDLNITPKQTATYEFSSPLPFNFALIDEMYEYNKTLHKSKVTSLYNNLPMPYISFLEENFQSNRGENTDIKSFDDFAKYVKYAQKKGFEFFYVLNSPKPFSEETFRKHEKDFYHLLDQLHNIGCNNIKVANTQVADIIQAYKHKFDLTLSTSFEFRNIPQYQNLMFTAKKIKTINVATDNNHNFHFLRNLRKEFPKTPIELIVNERCIYGCPGRIPHASTFFCIWDCYGLLKKIGHMAYFCKCNYVFPWDLEYYSAIGVNNFKLISFPLRAKFDSIFFLRNYIDCVEKGIDNMTVNDFFSGIYDIHDIRTKTDVKLSEIKDLFPDVRHFVKYGNRCADICGVECRYCFECADKLKKTGMFE